MTRKRIIYGWLTPELNIELKKLLEEAEWPPPEEPSPEFSAVLQVCDYAFLLKELKEKCAEQELSKKGHKKILIAKLLSVGEEDVTEIAQKAMEEINLRKLKMEEITDEEILEIARKVVG